MEAGGAKTGLNIDKKGKRKKETHAQTKLAKVARPLNNTEETLKLGGWQVPVEPSCCYGVMWQASRSYLLCVHTLS